MHPDSFFQKELLEDLRNRRGLILKFALPAALLLPLILADVPASLQAAGITVAVVFSGVFGSSIGLVRIRESGMLDRMALLPVSPRRLTAGYVLANALLDGTQVAIPLAAFLLVHPPVPAGILYAVVSFASAVVAANALGVLVAVVPGSSGEGHLYAVVTVMAAIALSGLVAPAPYTQVFLPFWYLYAALLAAPEAFALAPVLAALLLGSVLAISPGLFRSR
ncbi:ABC transporter permease [Methanoculleus chikugoensis]|uniref:ABC-2 family transporter protein n=1 Tax=Methanoculleus chikugoensis TaxID=118126 RepID=A0ABN5XLX9_9EURY|nr:ABC transporter permease [Methanoculleus chikugoensis]BBL68210.1 hypothetical protein MchiMG62_13910 [Methanoculleus chikugoensis]